jgi:hypothetical protein
LGLLAESCDAADDFTMVRSNTVVGYRLTHGNGEGQSD